VFSLFLYNISIHIYWFVIFCASFFNEKAKLWIDGRKNWKDNLAKVKGKEGKRIWVHCASLGEFEQARPVIEKFKVQNSKIILQIVVTFFSPSGYEIRKNFEGADIVLYLPLDTKTNARKFIESINPDIALFVKYEFWFHYLNELKKKNIPIILFSSVFRKNQIFFKWYGSFFSDMLKLFTNIFVQNIESKELLESISIKSEIAFDTRFDRVHQIAENKKELTVIEKFKGNSKILIAGSTWMKDEELIIRCINENVLADYKYIIAPHNIEQKRIGEIIGTLRVKSKRLSELDETNANDFEVLIIDSIGQLSSIYSFGEIAFIGGGFNSSVHNVLEAAVYAIPVLFGPNFDKSLEAKELLCFPVSDYDSFKMALNKLCNEMERIAIGKKGKKFIEERLGGAERIFEEINLCLKE